MVNQARYKNNKSIQFSFGVVMLSLAASPLDERKVTLRSLKPTASAATPLIRTVKERRTGSPVSPYPNCPAQLTYAAGPNPLWRAGRQAPETSSHSTQQPNANILLPVPYTP
ncbi:hypothetical protein TNCV_390521 [Trichonephila clavipes]|nr:hypothetical protein TNCV_390521 [Trichonephila clavipes]